MVMSMQQILLSPRELKLYEMVQTRLKVGCKIENILSTYEVSRRTFYVNLHKFQKDGTNGLKSKRGKHRKTKDNIEIRFEGLFKEHPHFSSYEFSQLISLNPRTIQRIIVRRKLTKAYKPKKERLILLEKLQQKKKKRLNENKAKK